MKEIKVVDKYAFQNYCGMFKNIKLIEVDNKTNNCEIYLIGSIIDKSEVFYRKSIGASVSFITVISTNDLDIDDFWKKNTTLISLEDFCKKTSKF